MVEDVNEEDEEDEGEEGDEEEEEEEETAQPWNGLKTLPVGCRVGQAVQGTGSAGIVLCWHDLVQGFAIRGWPCYCAGMGMVQGRDGRGPCKGLRRGKG